MPPGIYTTPTSNPVFLYLQVKNYLGEFKSEVDKARVRENLGIPDEYSYNWGHINGAIENQSDLMLIINSLTKKQTELTKQITGLSSTVNLLIGDDSENDTISTKELYNQLLSLKINVAQNSTDISGLISGGDTHLSTLVSENKTNINNIKSEIVNINSKFNEINEKLNEIKNTPSIAYDDTEIKSEINQLKSRNDLLTNKTNLMVTEINLLKSQISDLTSQVQVLNAYMAGNTITSIYASQTEYNTTINGINIQPHIYAVYTMHKDEEITGRCKLTNNTNTSLVNWNEDKLLIELLGNIGTATLTFEYNGFTVNIKINISAIDIPETDKILYIGIAPTYQEVFTDNECKYSKNILDGTYNNIKLISEGYLYLITTETLNSFMTDGQWSYAVGGDNLIFNQDTLNGNSYNIYKFKGDGLYGESDTFDHTFPVTLTFK